MNRQLDEMERRRQQSEMAKLAARAAIIQPGNQQRQFAVVVHGVVTDNGILQMGINLQGVNLLEARTILRAATDAPFGVAQPQEPGAEQPAAPGQEGAAAPLAEAGAGSESTESREG